MFPGALFWAHLRYWQIDMFGAVSSSTLAPELIAAIVDKLLSITSRDIYKSWRGVDQYGAVKQNLTAFLLASRGASDEQIAAIGAEQYVNAVLSRPVFAWDDTRTAETFDFNTGELGHVNIPLPFQAVGDGTFRVVPAFAAYSFAWGSEFHRDTPGGVVVTRDFVDGFIRGLADRIYRLYRGEPMEGQFTFVDYGQTSGVDFSKLRVLVNGAPSTAYTVAFKFGGWKFVDAKTGNVFYPVGDHAPSLTIDPASVENVVKEVNYFGRMYPNAAVKQCSLSTSDFAGAFDFSCFQPSGFIPDDAIGFENLLNWSASLVQPYINMGDKMRDARRKADLVSIVQGFMFVFGTMFLLGGIDKAIQAGGMSLMSGAKLGLSTVQFIKQTGAAVNSPSPNSSPNPGAVNVQPSPVTQAPVTTTPIVQPAPSAADVTVPVESGVESGGETVTLPPVTVTAERENTEWWKFAGIALTLISLLSR